MTNRRIVFSNCSGYWSLSNISIEKQTIWREKSEWINLSSVGTSVEVVRYKWEKLKTIVDTGKESQQILS